MKNIAAANRCLLAVVDRHVHQGEGTSLTRADRADQYALYLGSTPETLSSGGRVRQRR